VGIKTTAGLSLSWNAEMKRANETMMIAKKIFQPAVLTRSFIISFLNGTT
jgi:hypothetical protein